MNVTRLVSVLALAGVLQCGLTDARADLRQALADRAQEALEDRDLVVLLPRQSPIAADFLQARFPELRDQGADRDGYRHYLLAPEFVDRIPEIRETVTAMGGTMGKVLPSPRLQGVYKARLLAARAGQPDVVGLIVKYRDPGMRKRAVEMTSLEPSELARFERITGKAFAGSRSMYGENYVARLEQPVDLAEGEAIAARLAMAPDVERVVLDTVATAQFTPNDEFFSVLWNLGTGPGGIRAQAAWDVTQGSSNVNVAIVDSGILEGHPDLAGRIGTGIDTITDPESARDGNGRDSQPTDRGTYGTAAECGGTARTSSWHGTHVAGIIGANGNNGIGIAGVDWRARLVPVRALGRCGSGTASDIVDGIAWAAGRSVPGLPTNPNPARIVNASLGGPGNCTAYSEVLIDIAERGAVLIAAAGNENDNALNYRPASCALTLTVSSVGPGGEKASYSNYSAALEISAPGGDSALRGQVVDAIGSTKGGGTQAHDGTYTYQYDEGTSQAAPHVSGVAALMLSVAPNLTLAQIRDTIQLTARPYPSGTRCSSVGDCGPGILDASAAVQRARSINGTRNNYSSLWWRSSESGWGVNFAQQGDILFGTWFTYDSANNAVWYVMPDMRRVTDDYYEGAIYQTTGTPLHQINGSRASRSVTQVGTAAVQFFNGDKGFFGASVGGSTVFKQITIQEFSTVPTCSFTTGSRAGTTNYTDLWWNPAEDGWGINFAQQGDIIFATWFTYANDTSAIWLVADALRRSGNSFSGSVYLTTGKRPQDISGTSSILTVGNAGTMTVTFQDGEHATMSYNIAGTAGSKSLVRQVWSSPLTTCR